MADPYRSNGSAAYDVRRRNTAQPLERPERLPDAPARRKSARHVRARLGISPLTALGAAAAVLMLALVVFSYIRLYEARSDVGKLQTQLSTLEEQQARLQSQYDNALDLEQIEKRAKELGMRQPGSSQIIYVQVDPDDTTEVYAAPAEKNVFARVIDAFRSAFTDAINYFS